MEPLETIRRTIETDGPMSFADYMDAALYGPGGFYERHPVGRGPGSDFVTSPHVSPVFARLLALELERISPRTEVSVVELGAGDGTLAAQLREQLKERLDYTAVDVSPGAREALERRGLRTATLDDALPEGWSGVVLAHELLDNLPIHWVRRRDGMLEEVTVGIDGAGALAYAAQPCPEHVTAATPPIEEGEDATVSFAARDLLRELAARLGTGSAVLIIDYGSRGGGAPWCYLDHSRSDDLLEAPGSRDITSGVDFDSLTSFASSLGFETGGAITQREALTELGYASMDEELRHEQATAQDEARGREAVGIWSARREAASLVDPSGLGAHRWLTLRSAERPAERLTQGQPLP